MIATSYNVLNFSQKLFTVEPIMPMALCIFCLIAVISTFALIISLIVALTLIPMLAALGTGARYEEAGEESPPGKFTRMVASVVRLFAFVFVGIRWAFWAILWIPARLLQMFYKLVAQQLLALIYFLFLWLY